jgi:uncharacterized membrane protein HdeD (DUF308 family)
MISRRSQYLIYFGLVQVALGLAVLAQLGPTEDPLSIAIGRVVPPPIYGTLSVLGGIYSCIAAVSPERHRAQLKHVAFGVLAVLLGMRTLAHFYAAIVVPGVNTLQQVATGLVYLLVVRVHVLVARWPEPRGETGEPGASAFTDPVAFTEEIFKNMAERLIELDREKEAYREQLVELEVSSQDEQDLQAQVRDARRELGELRDQGSP